jgi:hypothetical protein
MNSLSESAPFPRMTGLKKNALASLTAATERTWQQLESWFAY